jgi:hypothetical protein
LHSSQNNSDDQIEEDEMGGACSTYAKEDKFELCFRQENMKGRDHWGDLETVGRVVLKWI